MQYSIKKALEYRKKASIGAGLSPSTMTMANLKSSEIVCSPRPLRDLPSKRASVSLTIIIFFRVFLFTQIRTSSLFYQPQKRH
jgi:hypothetical protein